MRKIAIVTDSNSGITQDGKFLIEIPQKVC